MPAIGHLRGGREELVDLVSGGGDGVETGELGADAAAGAGGGADCATEGGGAYIRGTAGGSDG